MRKSTDCNGFLVIVGILILIAIVEIATVFMMDTTTHTYVEKYATIEIPVIVHDEVPVIWTSVTIIEKEVYITPYGWPTPFPTARVIQTTPSVPDL